MNPVRTILVGGFLGAGKTTLLAKAGALLATQGKRVGILTNDQAPNLVDTALLRQQGFTVGEVCGGCFCCQFEKFVLASSELSEQHAPDVLLAEPVGSCTDISATVIQPLKQLAGHRFVVAPFSVVLDPLRLREALWGASQLAGSVHYIYEKQVEEADAILFNKADLFPAAELAEYQAQLQQRRPNARLFTLSALSGDGVAEWLEYVLKDQPAGRQLAAVDYDTYAAGEAALGWFNAAVELRSLKPQDWAAFARALMGTLQTALGDAKGEIAHLKIFLGAQAGSLVANLTHSAGQPLFRSEGTLVHSESAQLLINARVQIGAESLREIAERALRECAGNALTFTITQLESFSPARPQPTHRYSSVVP